MRRGSCWDRDWACCYKLEGKVFWVGKVLYLTRICSCKMKGKVILLGLTGDGQGLVLQAGVGVLDEVGTGVDQVLLLIAGGEGVMFDHGLL